MFSVFVMYCFFFFKQKTAYEMRISDWSSDVCSSDLRSTAIGIWYLSSGIGLALAFFIGGWIIEVSNWRWAFFAAGIPGLLLAPILFLTVREPKRGNRDEVPAVDETAGLSFVGRIRLLSSRPGLLHCISAIVLIATGIYGMSTWLTTFLIRSHGMPIGQAGLMVAIAYGVLGSVGGFAAGWIADWFNKRRGGFEPSRTSLFGATIPFIPELTEHGTVS